MKDRSTRAVGREAEAAAARFLEQRGYEILDRNVVTRRGEIDLIARSEETLCFIEVKSRRGREFGGGEAAVDAPKRARLWGAAEAYLADNAELWADPPECRFDVVTVATQDEHRADRWQFSLLANAFGRGASR